MLSVLLTGSIGVGKTTFFNTLPNLPGLIKIPEVAREILEQNPEIRLNPAFQKMLLYRQLELETAAAAQKPDVIICDRGYLDVIAYSKYFGISFNTELTVRFKPYDLVFYCHPEGTPPLPAPIDGVVPIEGEKEAIDECIRQILADHVSHYYILRGHTEQRLAVFYSVMNKVTEGSLFREGQFRRSKER